MAKKRFIKGLEDLLGGTADTPLPGEALPIVNQAGQPPEPEEVTKKPSGKTFSANLESFLSEVFEASFEEQLKNPGAKDAIPRKPGKGLAGLDALIRSTVNPESIQFNTENTRRVTLVLDQIKLEKLKLIARAEKTMLRDIIDDIVRDYIARYEREKNSGTA